jgi:MFS family permease
MKKETRLYIACIIALVTMAFGFVVRAFLITEWGQRFNLSETQIGSIQGAGLFPQALSIIFFSLIIDKVGYGRVMAFAWSAHVLSAILTITANSYLALYWGTFIFALAAGAVEAAINPMTATLFSKSKTHHLNILHAGWPGGLMLGGMLAISMSGIEGPNAWRWKIGLFLIPTAIYGAMMLGQRFPIQERVAAGVSYTDMLSEFGWGGCYIVFVFVAYAIDEISRVLGFRFLPEQNAVAAALLYALIPTVLFVMKIRSFGRPLFVFLLFTMILLATTEVGTDSWIAALMTPVLKHVGENAGNWVLVYTSAIMFVLRFFAGPIAHRISPLGLLAAGAAVACAGLNWLSAAGTSAALIFLAATCYGLGKSFFWPTTLGVVSEQFPKGGALTLNAIAGVGMISVGVLGNPLLGALQDHSLDRRLGKQNPALHAKVAGTEQSKYGLKYQPLDKSRIAALPAEEKESVENVRVVNNQAMLAKVALLPAIMFACYLSLILYFRSRGGYQQVELAGADAAGGALESGRTAGRV